MPLRPVHIEQFGGVNLRDDPDEVGLNQAIDLLNVDFDKNGLVRSRDGSAHFSTAVAASRYFGIGQWTTRTIAARISTTFVVTDVLDTTGAVISTQSTTGTIFQAVPFGSATTQITCFVTGGDVVQEYYSGGFSLFLASPSGARCIAVQRPDNRLVVANNSTNPWRVWFSGAGAPGSWGANDYVDLDPGISSAGITALVQWRDLLFAFKSQSFYVFYGNSTDGTGQPIFNFRAVDTGRGSYGLHTACAGDDGVYFLDATGVYRTTGGTPVCVSDAIASLFDGTLGPFYQGSGFNSTLAAGTAVPKMAWHHGRLYVALPTGTSTANDRLCVYSPTTNTWTIHDLAVTGMLSTQNVTTGLPELRFGSVAANYVDAMRTGLTTDAGAAITSRYRSGFSDLGFPGQEKVIRETELAGTGTVQFGYARDFGSITTTSQANVTLGTSPATTRKLHRKSQDGELFSWQANSVSGGAWALNQLTPMLRDVRDPAELTS